MRPATRSEAHHWYPVLGYAVTVEPPLRRLASTLTGRRSHHAEPKQLVLAREALQRVPAGSAATAALSRRRIPAPSTSTSSGPATEAIRLDRLSGRPIQSPALRTAVPHAIPACNGGRPCPLRGRKELYRYRGQSRRVGRQQHHRIPDRLDEPHRRGHHIRGQHIEPIGQRPRLAGGQLLPQRREPDRIGETRRDLPGLGIRVVHRLRVDLLPQILPQPGGDGASEQPGLKLGEPAYLMGLAQRPLGMLGVGGALRRRTR